MFVQNLKKIVSGTTLVMLFSNVVASAGVFYVDTSSGINVGTCVYGEQDMDGDCSLKDALDQSVGGDTVRFLSDFTILNAGGSGFVVDKDLTISGVGSTVEIDGEGTSSAITISANADGATIDNLYVYDGNPYGIDIQDGASGIIVQNSTIGTDELNTSGIGSATAGLGVFGQQVTVDDNTISGNDLYGVYIGNSAQDLTIANNKIGTTPDGLTDLGNGNSGIYAPLGTTANLNGTADTGLVIGGDSSTGANVISGNGVAGVRIQGADISGDLTVQGNLIGLDATGDTAMKNDFNALYVVLTNSSADVLIGDDGDDVRDDFEGNTLVNNTNEAVYISGGGSIRISGNIVGLNEDGLSAVASSGDAIVAIGGATTPVTINENVVGSNDGNGITIEGGSPVNVTGNIVGMNVNGDATGISITNGYGIEVGSTTTSDITIGGNTEAEGNVIGNLDTAEAIGVYVRDLADGATVNFYNNKIGVTTDGSTAAPIASYAIRVEDGETINIGGNGIGNIISNYLNGISIVAGSTVTIQDNMIGLTEDGLTVSSGATQGGYAIDLDSSTLSSVLIGGATAALSNVIANNSVGVRVVSVGTAVTDLVEIQGNLFGVGIDEETVANLSNDNAIVIGSGNVVVGGENELGTDGTGTRGEGNVISNSNSDGLQISSVTVGTVEVYGNVIGLVRGAISGIFDTASANLNGIKVTSDSVDSLTVGAADGTFAYSKRNIISGNDEMGISVDTNGLALLNVINNFVGADWLGMTAVPNLNDGMDIDAGESSVINIGGTGTNEGNLISGNADEGIMITGGGTVSVFGNYIGTTVDGDAALSNDGGGFSTDVSEALTLVVGDGTDEGRNVISGNDGGGITIQGTTVDATIQGNYIGVDVTGLAALSNGVTPFFGLFHGGGILVLSHAVDSLLVGTDGDGTNDENEGNVISANYGQGIFILGNSDGMEIAGNYIGLAADGITELGNLAGSLSYDFFGEGSGDILNGSGIFAVDGNSGALNDLKIGGSLAAQRNVIANNEGAGIVVGHFDDGTGQNWLHGYIKNNYIGLLADGVTSSNNDVYEVYVNEYGGTISRFSFGDANAKNVVNNRYNVGVYFADFDSAGFLGTDYDFDNIESLNTWFNTSCPVANNYWEWYMAAVLRDYAPSCEEESEETAEEAVVTTESSGSGGSSSNRSGLVTNERENTTTENNETEREIIEEDEYVEREVDDTEEDSETSTERETEDEVEERDSGEAQSTTERDQQTNVESSTGSGESTTTTRPRTATTPSQTAPSTVDTTTGQVEANSVQSSTLTETQGVALERYRETASENVVTENEFVKTVDITEDLVSTRFNEEINDGDLSSVNVKDGVEDISIGGDDRVVFSDSAAGGAGESESGLVTVTPSTINADHVSLVFAIMNGFSMLEVDVNANEIPNSQEIFWGVHPSEEFVVEKALLEGPKLTNNKTINGTKLKFPKRPSLRFFGEDGMVELIIVDEDELELKEEGEEYEIVEEAEVEIVNHMGEYTLENDLDDGVYLVFITDEEERVSVYDFEVDNGAVSELELVDVEFDEELGLLTGYTEPGAVVMITWKSVIISSVIVADASQGYFEIEVPDSLPDGEHNVVVYAYKEDADLGIGFMGNVFNLIFNK